MANRAELPREKKMKQRIVELEEELRNLSANYKIETENARYLNEQLKEQEDKNAGLVREVNVQTKQIREYEREFNRKQKLIDFLIDSKL